MKDDFANPLANRAECAPREDPAILKY